MMLHGTVFPFQKLYACRALFLCCRRFLSLIILQERKNGGIYRLTKMRKNGPIHLDKVLENAFLTGAGLPATINTV